MKSIIKSQDNLFAMSKISDKYVIEQFSDMVDKFICFSEANSSHGPRIKFDGGTKETGTTQSSPTLAFTISGECSLELADWMNAKNCPNAFNSKYLAKIERFVKKAKPILLLVWFKHLDEADALAYFHNQLNWEKLLSSCDPAIPTTITSLENLDKYCIEHELYAFQ